MRTPVVSDDLATLVGQRASTTYGYRPRVLDPADDADCDALTRLLRDPLIEVHDTLVAQLGELVTIRDPQITFSQTDLAAATRALLGGVDSARHGVWVHYPWARRIVHLLAEPDFVAVRTSRNQYKITPAEQRTLATKRIGVVGLSVGQTVALALAMERCCREIRLADFDVLELSNLNRVRAGVTGLGVPKAVIAAREIAELDPFLDVTCFLDGISAQTVDPFLTEGGKLDLVVEVCDSLDVKLLVRQKARAAGIPVLMHTSDRGMLDVERFDREPDRPLLHGLLDDLDADDLAQLSTEQKVPIVLHMLGIDSVSLRLKASMLEIEQSIPTWPQLAHAVMLGGAAVGDTARRILLDQFHESGRYYVDLDSQISGAPEAVARAVGESGVMPRPLTVEQMIAATDGFVPPDAATRSRIGRDEITRLVKAATSAPSAGNAQPWQWLSRGGNLHLFCDPSRGSFLDLASTASYVSLGAAAETLVIAAAADGLCAQVHLSDAHPLAATFTFTGLSNAEPEVQQFISLARSIPLRSTNRRLGTRGRAEPELLNSLTSITDTVPGARLRFLTSEADLREVGTIVGAAERIRLLNRASHDDFISEIRWTAAEARATCDGIDLATIDLTATERAGMDVARAWPVAQAVRQWGGGGAFEQLARKSVDAASAVGLFTVPGRRLRDHFQLGRALQRCWLAATEHHIAVQPVASATFLFARLDDPNATGLDRAEIAELQELRRRFAGLFPHTAEGPHAMVLIRLAIAAEPATHSLRRPVDRVLTVVDDEADTQ